MLIFELCFTHNLSWERLLYHQHPVEVLESDLVADLPETDTLLVQVTSRALYEQAHTFPEPS